MKSIKVFAEHERHIKFIKDLLLAKFNLKLNDNDFINLSGIENIGITKTSFQMNTDDGGVNLVILDTLFSVSRDRSMLTQIKQRYKIEFEHFILPNNKDNGKLEDLLYELIPSKFDNIKTCQLSFGAHLVQHGYTTLSASGIIYTYLDSVLEEGTDKEMIAAEIRNYNDKKYWNIHHHAVDPLAAFLGTHIK